MEVLTQISRGMPLEAVQQVLSGWKSQVCNAMLSTDRLHLFHTWDFLPPPNSPHKPQRMTFDNGKLLIWGEPADLEKNNGGRSMSA